MNALGVRFDDLVASSSTTHVVASRWQVELLLQVGEVQSTKYCLKVSILQDITLLNDVQTSSRDTELSNSNQSFYIADRGHQQARTQTF